MSAKLIRAQEKNGYRVPIALTAHDDEETRTKAIAAGIGRLHH